LSAAPFAIVARAFLRGCAAFSAINPHVALPVLSLGQGIALSTAACVLLLARRASIRCSAGILGVIAALMLEWQLRRVEQPEGSLRATFLDVGQGDATLIDLPNGQSMLIDAGGNPQGGADPGERVLVPLLRARRRAHIDLVVLTHPHPDHFGGLSAVLENVKVGEFWDSGQSAAEADFSATSRQALALVHKARAGGARVLYPPQLCGRPRNFGAARVEVLWPCPDIDAGFDPNDNSLVLRVSYGKRALLFTGDIEAHAESELLASGARLRADVLKVPHHGSRTSSSSALLAAIAPSLAVISAGAVNPFGHPHSEVVARLRMQIRRVIDLGQHGGSVLTIDSHQGMHVDGREL
jgi:competence protein ComEC